MHIPENYLSPATCAVMTTAMLPVWRYSIRKVSLELPKEKLPLLGVGAAFSFLGMMFNVPLVGGTTGHAVGGTLIALLFGPGASCLAVSVALLLQAVIFGDGGILAFGANCFNMAFVLPFVGYGIFEWLKKRINNESIAAAVGSYIGLNAAAFCAAIEFGIQPLLFKDAAGNALYCPYDLSISIPAMMIPHLAVAGIVEAVFTVCVYNFVKRTAPDMILTSNTPASEKGYFPVFALIAVLIAATPLGLLAAGTAWGEWGADEIAETAYSGSLLGYVPKGMESGWSMEAPIPDYAVSGMNDVLAYILSAIIGVALLVIFFKLFQFMIKGKKESYAS